MIEIIRGDTVTFNCDISQNIQNWKIRAEFFSNDKTIELKKASANTGGSAAQIEIVDDVTGLFNVIISAGESENWESTMNFEIEVETPAGDIYTVLQETLKIKEQQIKWETP